MTWGRKAEDNQTQKRTHTLLGDTGKWDNKSLHFYKSIQQMQTVVSLREGYSVWEYCVLGVQDNVYDYTNGLLKCALNRSIMFKYKTNNSS